MTKYFLVGLSILFLCSCAPEENPDEPETQPDETLEQPDNQPEERDEPDDNQTEDTADKAPQATITIPPIPPLETNTWQSCTTNLISVTWRCTAGTDTVEYFVNQRPTTVDDEGTEKERVRICELSRTFKEETKILNYAHNEKDWCVNKLNTELTAKKNSNFSCEKTEELLDQDRTSEPCPGA